MRPVPLDAALHEEGNRAQHGSHDDHRVQTDKPALEKSFHRQRPVPAVVVSIADDEARQYKEEVNGQVAVVDALDIGLPAGKGIALEYVVPYNEHRGHSAQTVKQAVMGFCVAECGRSGDMI